MLDFSAELVVRHPGGAAALPLLGITRLKAREIMPYTLLFMVLAAVNIVYGGAVTLRQTDIKRLMAFSSIAHMGYALMGLAAGTAFGVQAMINMGVAVRLLPAKGMTLPFVSYGGSSLIASGIAVGMLLAFTRSRPQGVFGDALTRRADR